MTPKKSSIRSSIRDVAAVAGVSPTTVSQALNNVAGARIAEPTRARIREIANEPGYTPSRMARGLRLQRSNTIGLISDHIATTPYAGKIILGAQQAARERGWWLLLLSTEGDPDVEAHAAKQLLLHDVEGVLYATMYHRLVDLPDVLSSTATVLIDAEAADRTVPAVVPDEVGGGRAATHALVTAGHTRIGLATNIDDIPATHVRLKGYRAALAGGESATTPGRSSPPHRRRIDDGRWLRSGLRAARSTRPPDGAVLLQRPHGDGRLPGRHRARAVDPPRRLDRRLRRPGDHL